MHEGEQAFEGAPGFSEDAASLDAPQVALVEGTNLIFRRADRVIGGGLDEGEPPADGFRIVEVQKRGRGRRLVPCRGLR